MDGKLVKKMTIFECLSNAIQLIMRWEIWNMVEQTEGHSIVSSWVWNKMTNERR